MTERYSVRLAAPALPVAADRPIVFHGVNKSGSLAMERVLREAYYTQSRAHEFFSHYSGVPKHLDTMAEIMRHSSGPRCFVGHYIYQAFDLPADALLVSQVRHPVPRMLSVYGWLVRNDERKHGKGGGIPDFETWLRGSKGRRHTQMSQFALGFAPDYKRKLTTISANDLADRAIERLERDFAWIGVAEYFEESIFAMAHICGLDSVAPWEKDMRNVWRQPLKEVDTTMLDLIESTMTHELRFYRYAVDLFRKRIAEIDFGPELGDYRLRCEAAYGDRILV